MTRMEELRRGWLLVLVCGVGFGLGLSGLPFYTYGVFVGPLRETFGWSMALTQGGLTMSYLTTVIAIPVTGWLADRFGARAVVLTSLVLYSLSVMLLSRLNGDRWLFLAAWVLISATGTGTLALTWSRAISGAFDKGRGLALGLALMGSGVVAFVGPPLARALVEHVGWRLAYVGLGAAPLILAFPLALAVFRDRPAAAAGPAAAVDGHSLAQALRDRRLWIVGGCFWMIGAGVTALVPNLIKVLTLTGIAMDNAVYIVSLVGLFVIAGRLLCGALLDRFWAPRVGAVFLVLPAAACLILGQAHIPLPAAAAAAALLGLTLGAEFDLLPYLVSRYFGLARFGAVLGVASACFYLGCALGAPAMGRVLDITGGYGAGLVAVAVLFGLSASGMLLLGPYPARGESGHHP